MSQWKKISAVLLLVGLLYFIVFHWNRFLSDFWPIDHSNVGPNLVASVVQYAILAVLLVLLYPPFRRAVERFAKRHVEDLKNHISEENKVLHDKLHVMHETQKHIIRHTDGIPNKIPGLSDEHQP